MSIADIRREYTRAELDEESVLDDPIAQLQRWIEEAERAGAPEHTAMTLATADANGRPSARVVLLKGLDREGLVFFTDYRSRKGRELTTNPQASVVFYWSELERQVRATGRVERVTRADSATYFASRPEGSQLGAWASEQSEALPDRATLDARVEATRQRFAGGPVPLPPHWGGFRLVPDEVEFWQGRESRLHDRILYRLAADGRWMRGRLSP
jgi:pyridoxamine 5'-phosphate oxidase